MNTIPSIYTPSPIDLSTILHNEYTTDEIIQYYTNAEVFGNRAKTVQCILCAKYQAYMHKQHNGNIKTKAYNATMSTFIDELGIKKKAFQKYAQIGNIIMASDNPETLMDKPLSGILPPSLPAKKTPKANTPTDNTNHKLDELTTEYRILSEWLDKVYAERGGFDAICDKLQINRW